MKSRPKIPATAYQVVIEYSPEDRGFIARAPALKYCTAFGVTYEKAAREIQSAIEGWLETAAVHDTPVPSPGTAIGELQAAAEMLNLTGLARESGIPAQTLFAKLRRGTAFKPGEALAVARALNEAGLHLVAKAG